MEGHDATGEVAPGHVPPAVGRHARCEPGLVGPGADGFGEVLVRVGVGRDPAGHRWQQPQQASALQSIRPGGLVVGTVPALMGLWSNVDVASGHKTRYSKGRLAALLGGMAGARTVEVEYFNRVLIPLLWVRRMVARTSSAEEVARNLSVPAAPINQAMNALVLAEHGLSRALEATPIPGSSLWFALQRLE